jgi:iron(III) transport system substrate-binding protein
LTPDRLRHYLNGQGFARSHHLNRIRSNTTSRSGSSRETRHEEVPMKFVCGRALARTGVAVSAIIAGGAVLAQSSDVNVYTYRESKLIQPLFDAFTKDTGIKVNVISASSGLEQRIKTEGANSPADVLLTVDIGRLEEAARSGITQPIKSDLLDKVVAPQYRDPEGHWYGVSMRARVAYVSKDRVPQTTLTYEELADPKWKGKICIRSGQHIYNNALIAAYIAHHGEAKAEEWLKGVKANLAQKPSGGDRETARDVAAGKCDIGIGNTYYWALMNNNEPDKKAWADATKVILLTFQDGGTHVNISGVVLAKHAPNKANAMKFIEWLASEKAQHMHADLNYEYPVRAGIEINPTIAGYGKLNADPIPISKIADNKKTAANLVDKVGFDN